MKDIEFNLGGITPFSTVDYPKELAAVLFAQGCSWRCRYCHNPKLTSKESCNSVTWESAIALLQRRVNYLTAVVFSGGEPTLQATLIPAMRQVKEMGYKIGLHTSGANTSVLEQAIPLVDWIGYDIKATRQNYSGITGATNSGKVAWDNLELIIDSEINYEVRITLNPELTSLQELLNILYDLKIIGAENIVIQQCNTNITLDRKLQGKTLDFIPYFKTMKDYPIR